MRQRVALSRILPGLAVKKQTSSRRMGQRRTNPKPRRWWLATALVAAAASIVVVVVWSGSQNSRSSTPDVATQPDPMTKPDPVAVTQVRLADGTTWQVGEQIKVIRSQSTTFTLADGTMLALSGETAMTVAAPDQSWRMSFGTVHCRIPSEHGALRTGIVTKEASVQVRAGEFEISASNEGTVVHSIIGEVAIQDTVTSLRSILRAGSELWIPSDVVAPNKNKGASGVTRGTIESIEKSGHRFALLTRFGSFPFTPVWLNTPYKGLDREMSARIAKLHVGDRVKVSWEVDEMPRVTRIYVISPAGEPAATLPDPHHDDF